MQVALAQELMKYSLEIKTKESDVIVAFSNALMDIPKIICDNCGFDGDNSKNLLKSKYNSMKNLKNFTHGIDIKNGLSICMKEIGVLEGFEMKRRVITAACETAQTILKVDGVARCAPRLFVNILFNS
ncbi:unnamed protein product [Medioppia subpectinata]|uniref:Uncharacterized protein n=1 Tax=Medioppia subpectinata TaxID=1979941 RepID=A0A7R9PUJ2_9ACAR|nr:unnamed protein product [Medioppia subpectinata]CAG2101277.1 unnamed protein product [Medioppia subpectinata]